LQTYMPREQFARIIFGNTLDRLERIKWFVAFAEVPGAEFQKIQARIYYRPGDALINALFYGENPMKFGVQK
jgi:hypothetical protein